jgi:hypothetical protein
LRSGIDSGSVLGMGSAPETEQEHKTRKVRENKLRRAAERQGLTLHRSPRRDPRALDYGKYWLFRDNMAAEGSKTSVTPEAGVALDEIETYLTGEQS